MVRCARYGYSYIDLRITLLQLGCKLFDSLGCSHIRYHKVV